MSNVLTDDVALKCASGAVTAPHGGTLGASGVSRLRIDGKSALTKTSITSATITGCGNTDTSHGQVQCPKATGPSSASKLKVDGDAVVLDSISATTTGTPPGKLVVSGTAHTRLRTT